MPRFEPLSAVRYDTDRVSIDDVVAPPYDVIGPDERELLAARSPYNVVHVDLPGAEADGDPYTAAGARFAEWLGDGVMAVDEQPGFYVYRMGWHDESGRAGQTTGVIGALELAPPGERGVLPHERTMGKPKDDRLNLMRATRANLSPIWGLSLASGLSALCDVSAPPLVRHTDEEGVHHRLWPLDQPAVVAAVRETVASAPVVIADGHHRYETALAYAQEQRDAGAGAGDHDLAEAERVGREREVRGDVAGERHGLRGRLVADPAHGEGGLLPGGPGRGDGERVPPLVVGLRADVQPFEKHGCEIDRRARLVRHAAGDRRALLGGEHRRDERESASYD